MRGSPFGFTNFSRGLNVLDSPYTLNDGEARAVLNMVSSPRGAIKKRYGSTIFASGVGSFMPTLAVTDSANRVNEEPLSNSGKWKAVTLGIGATAPRIFEHAIAPNVAGGECASVWQENIVSPAISLELSKSYNPEEPFHSSFGLIACYKEAEGGSWYFAEWERFSGAFWVTVHKQIKGVAVAGLGKVSTPQIRPQDEVGMTVKSGVVSLWHKSGELGPWVKDGEFADTSLTEGFSGVFVRKSGTVETQGRNFSTGTTPASLLESEITSLLPCKIGSVNYLIAVAGKKIFSVTETGEVNDITGAAVVTEGSRWSIIQSTSGSPNRIASDGPIYLSNGVNPPLYWTGATKTTVVLEWTSKPEGTFVAVPKAKYLTYLGNRVWASGIAGDTSALRFSGFAVRLEEGEQADPTNWPKENVVWFEKEDGDAITGTGIAGSYLMVFKPHKTWAVFDLNEGENRRLSDNVGCISYRSIVETPQGTFFLTPDQGVYVTNGTSLREVSRNVRPILQGTDPVASRAAKLDQLENTAAGYLNGHYYLSYMAQDGSMKTLDYDTVLQSWWLHDLAGNQWVHWEPAPGNSSLYVAPHVAKGGVVKAFIPGLYLDSGANYVGGNGLTCYWLSPWEPFFQYVLRHRINQPQTKKRVRELFVDGKGELVTLVSRKFGTALETLKGTVDNADMAVPASPVKLGTGEQETQAARYYALGVSRVWSFGFGNASGEPLEVDTYAVDLSFRKS